METIPLNSPDKEFIREVQERSGQNVLSCYQCGNCTAGCPYNFAYDLSVSRVMRLVQLGQREAVLKSHSIWLCATCQSCTTRCPNSIDVAKIMDVLRHMAREAGYATERNIKAFGDAFLESVEKHGRVYELGVTASYIRKTGRFWTDVDLAPAMLPKNKLSIKPHEVRGKEHVSAIFKRFRERDTAKENS
jgi:heterodisulfide reductase subunit C